MRQAARSAPPGGRPSRVAGGGLEASFAALFDKATRTGLGIIASSTDQCFGRW
ncbi:hypothetical protein AB1K54_11925 [Microbacterium sp. BWT-B31]|uniref:hypothetical protein n=1 Tax=Microbacterium sp. BWT-B31 TaxID=3232072 RepID=UPI0035278889